MELAFRYLTVAATLLAVVISPAEPGRAETIQRYLRQDSPLGRIEAMLGIGPASSRNPARLTGISRRTPAAVLSATQPVRSARFSGVRSAGSGSRRQWSGVQGGITSRALLGLRRLFPSGERSAGSKRSLYGVSHRTPASILNASQNRSQLVRWGGDRYRRSILGARVPSRNQWYGGGLSRRSPALLGSSNRLRPASRAMSGVSVRTPAATLNRSGPRLRRLSGRRLFGL